MKKTLRELEALFTFASMIGFIVFAILGLRSLDGKGELDREVENAQCYCEDCAADRATAVVVSSDEVEELEQDVGVRSKNQPPRAEPKAAEDQGKLSRNDHGMGIQNRPNLVPMNDGVKEKAASSYERNNDLNRRVVDCLQNILLCMFCLFNLLLPVVFNNIIPNQTSQKTV